MTEILEKKKEEIMWYNFLFGLNVSYIRHLGM